MARRLFKQTDLDWINQSVHEREIRKAQAAASLPFTMFSIIAIGWMFAYVFQDVDSKISAYLFFGAPVLAYVIKIVSKISNGNSGSII